MHVEPDSAEDWTRPGVYEVVPGVYRIPLPLPTDGLKAVNIYALTGVDGRSASSRAGADGRSASSRAGADGRSASSRAGADEPGPVLIDSGWAITEARETLDAALDTLGHTVADVRRFLVTHIHRDHYQMAVAVRREFGNQVSLGAGEEPAITLLSEPMRRPMSGRVEEMRRYGATDLVAWLMSRMDQMHHDPAAWAPPDDWLQHDQTVAVPARTLRVIATPGHTRGHVVFVDADARMMFAGDHVLPHITPSIGFEAYRSEQPLGSYLDSLRLVRALPDQRLLPAHGPVSPSVHARVDQLLDHHAHRLDQAVVAVGEGGTAFDAAQRLTWTRRERKLADLDEFNQMLAVAETAAHLDLLVAQGRLRSTDTEGVLFYQSG